MDAWDYRISVACDFVGSEFIILSPSLVRSTPFWLSQTMSHMHAPTFDAWQKKENENKKVTLHVLTYGAMWGCGLTSLMVCSNDEIRDIRERTVTIRNTTWSTNIRDVPLGFGILKSESYYEGWYYGVWGVVGQDPCDSKSNRLHVWHLPVLLSFIWGVFYETPLKWSVIFLQSWSSTGYFSNSTGSFVTKCQFVRSSVRNHEEEDSSLD